MKTVGNHMTETDGAMELCKEVQVEEYVIHAVESTNFYTHLQFSLLASTWFPGPLGVCLWSVLHVLLVLSVALMLLVLFSVVFVLAVLMDAILVVSFISGMLAGLFLLTIFFLFNCIGLALLWLWLVITCQCSTIAGRAPNHSNPQPAPVVEGGAAAADGHLYNDCITLSFVNHVILVSFPYWRVKLGDFCREIVPSSDSIVI